MLHGLYQPVSFLGGQDVLLVQSLFDLLLHDRFGETFDATVYVDVAPRLFVVVQIILYELEEFSGAPWPADALVI